MCEQSASKCAVTHRIRSPCLSGAQVAVPRPLRLLLDLSCRSRPLRRDGDRGSRAFQDGLNRSELGGLLRGAEI